MSFPKDPQNRCEEYLVWVRAQPSVLSGHMGCLAHHIIGHNRCSSIKTSDFLAIPLTDAEHKRLHDHGWREWEAEHGSQLEYSARTMDRAISEGILVCDRKAARRAAA